MKTILMTTKTLIYKKKCQSLTAPDTMLLQYCHRLGYHPMAKKQTHHPYTSFKTDCKLDTAKRHAKSHSTSTPISCFPNSTLQVLLTLGECWVVMGAVVNRAGVRLQARSGQLCGRRVKRSSNYHADTWRQTIEGPSVPVSHYKSGVSQSTGPSFSKVIYLDFGYRIGLNV